MTLLLAALLIACLAAGWVVYPVLIRRWSLLEDFVPVAVQAHEARKRVALAALKDVELDRAAGKLDDADYREIRTLLEMEAVQALASAEAVPISPAAAVEAHTCGFSNPTGSQFCSGCGQRLA